MRFCKPLHLVSGIALFGTTLLAQTSQQNQFSNALLPTSGDPSIAYRASGDLYWGSASGQFDDTTNQITLYYASGLADLFQHIGSNPQPNADSGSVLIPAAVPTGHGQVWNPTVFVDTDGGMYVIYTAKAGSNSSDDRPVSPCSSSAPTSSFQPSSSSSSADDGSDNTEETNVTYLLKDQKTGQYMNPAMTSSWSTVETKFKGYGWSYYRQTLSDGSSQLYAFYSLPGRLFAQAMTDPLTIASGTSPNIISEASDVTSSPLYAAWEHVDIQCNYSVDPGYCGANEAPQAFQVPSTGTIYLNYSGNSSHGGFYALGLLQFIGSGLDRLDDPTKWNKLAARDGSNRPWFSSPVWDYTKHCGQTPNPTYTNNENYVVGTGTATVFADRNQHLWKLYSGYFHDADSNAREVRMQKVQLTGGVPDYPQPNPTAEGTLLTLPDNDASFEQYVAQSTVPYTSPKIYYSGCIGSNVTGASSTYPEGGLNNACPGSGENGDKPSRTAAWVPDSQNAYAYSTNPFSYYLIRFSGQYATIQAPCGPTFGMGALFLDGTLFKTLDFSTPTACPANGMAVPISFSTAGQHTATMLVTGQPGTHPADDGTTGTSVGLISFSIN